MSQQNQGDVFLWHWQDTHVAGTTNKKPPWVPSTADGMYGRKARCRGLGLSAAA